VKARLPDSAAGDPCRPDPWNARAAPDLETDIASRPAGAPSGAAASSARLSCAALSGGMSTPHEFPGTRYWRYDILHGLPGGTIPRPLSARDPALPDSERPWGKPRGDLVLATQLRYEEDLSGGLHLVRAGAGGMPGSSRNGGCTPMRIERRWCSIGPRVVRQRRPRQGKLT